MNMLHKNNTIGVRTQFFRSGSTYPTVNKQHILGSIYYGMEPEESIIEQPFISIKVPVKSSAGFYELWISSGKTSKITIDNFSFGMDGENLFGCVSFSSSIGKGELHQKTEDIYKKLFTCIQELNYPYLYRMWNYIPQINQKEGIEKYKAFCLGRNNAFQKFYGKYTDLLPAATGIGKNDEEHINLFFLAGRYKNIIHIENPRQTPAYHYPVRYGPKPPSFSRATGVFRTGSKLDIFVSGTASIIGSSTVYVKNLTGQCKTTLDNIKLLLSEDNLARYNIPFHGSLADMNHIKIYYRQEKDLPVIQEFCDNSFSLESSKEYIQADICRKELLLEIEGSIQDINL